MTRRSYSLVPGVPPTTPFQYATYLREQLGVTYPPGSRRSNFLGQLKQEMVANGWSFEDLVQTVEYIKQRRIRIKNPYGVFYHVNDAKAAQDEVDSYDLISSVAVAISQETDQRWLQRLSLAKGKALERVYREWRLERAHV